MRDIDSALYNALAAANTKGLVPRRLVYMTGVSFSTGNPTEVAFWTGKEEEDFNVESYEDDTIVSRTYTGGVALETSSIPLVSDLTIQTVEVSANILHPDVEAFVRGSNLRLGRVEIHDVLLDTTSRDPVSTGVLVFLGLIDGAPIELPKKGGVALVRIRASSDAILMLSRTNPAKSSYQEQSRRSNDQFGKHSAVVSTWNIKWGQNG